MTAKSRIVGAWKLAVPLVIAAMTWPCSAVGANPAKPAKNSFSRMKSSEKQITFQKSGHILTNIGVWSPDGEWVVYDVRSDPAGNVFDGTAIEMVNTHTGEVKRLYQSRNGACCGVVTFNPKGRGVVFILGPEFPDAAWNYGPYHRQGIMVDLAKPGIAVNLDARDLTPPFTPGALRGGSHVHVWDPAGQWVSFTYEDHLLAQFKDVSAGNDLNLRNIGVAVPGRPVRVPGSHPRNHNGEAFCTVVTRTTASPKPGSDDIRRAFEEGWIGTNGYLRSDGLRQQHALAFQGEVLAKDGTPVSEVFIADLPEDLTIPGNTPLQGTETTMPAPPRGTVQRRLTHTAERKFPGIQGVRHWLRSSPDGSRIAFLMKDDNGVAQLWFVSPNGGAAEQQTRNQWPIASTFTWSSDGRLIAHVMDNSVCVSDTRSGKTQRLTARTEGASAPRPESCVFSPDGKKIAFVRRILESGVEFNQIFVVDAVPLL